MTMPTLKGSKTAQNLKDAFAGESQANRRYLYFAQKADVEGFNDVSAVFRSTAEGETGHAHGHLEFLEAVGDPATGEPIGSTDKNLKASIAGETHEYTDMYPGMVRTSRAKKASTKSPTGSRRSRKPKRATPAASRKRSTRSGSKNAGTQCCVL
jgi:rubrerythrin